MDDSLITKVACLQIIVKNKNSRELEFFYSWFLQDFTAKSLKFEFEGFEGLKLMFLCLGLSVSDVDSQQKELILFRRRECAWERSGSLLSGDESANKTQELQWSGGQMHI